jgi:hypothetical protein
LGLVVSWLLKLSVPWLLGLAVSQLLRLGNSWLLRLVVSVSSPLPGRRVSSTADLLMPVFVRYEILSILVPWGPSGCAVSVVILEATHVLAAFSIHGLDGGTLQAACIALGVVENTRGAKLFPRCPNTRDDGAKRARVVQFILGCPVSLIVVKLLFPPLDLPKIRGGCIQVHASVDRNFE